MLIIGCKLKWHVITRFQTLSDYIVSKRAKTGEINALFILDVSNLINSLIILKCVVFKILYLQVLKINYLIVSLKYILKIL